MQIIKVKFLKGDAPTGKPYTYYSPVAVAVGDKVQINESAVGVVVEVDVPEAEVVAYRDKLKVIQGWWGEKVEYTPPETYDPLAATVAQSRYCRERGIPHFAPKSGKCWKCGYNIYLPANTATESPAISVEQAGREHITGCPYCHWSFCE